MLPPHSWHCGAQLVQWVWLEDLALWCVSITHTHTHTDKCQWRYRQYISWIKLCFWPVQGSPGISGVKGESGEGGLQVRNKAHAHGSCPCCVSLSHLLHLEQFFFNCLRRAGVMIQMIVLLVDVLLCVDVMAQTHLSVFQGPRGPRGSAGPPGKPGRRVSDSCTYSSQHWHFREG